jgi:hypothetical protein
MTEDMNEIARKTKIETVSMKVITLVTLFFLPGTFTSVGRIFLSVSPVFIQQDCDSSVFHSSLFGMNQDAFEADFKLLALLDSHEHRHLPPRL